MTQPQDNRPRSLGVERLDQRLNLSAFGNLRFFSTSPAQSQTATLPHKSPLESLSFAAPTPITSSTDKALSAIVSPLLRNRPTRQLIASNQTTAITQTYPSTQPSDVVTPTAVPSTATRQLAGPLLTLSSKAVPGTATNISSFVWVTSDTTPSAAARESLLKPQGSAALFLWDMASTLVSSPQDHLRDANGHLTTALSPWFDTGAFNATKRADAFFSAYKAAGGRLDFLVLDYELPFDIWSLTKDQVKYLATDPRTAPVLKAIGASSMADVMDSTKPYYTRWNVAMADLTNTTLNKVFFDTARKYFPNARGSNFDSFATDLQNVMPDANGHREAYDTHAGTANSVALYGWIDGIANQKLDGTSLYTKTPFTVLRYETNKLRAVVRGSADEVFPWIAHKNFTSSSYRNNDYYQEQLYHLALNGASGFLFWNPTMWQPGQNPADWSDDAQNMLVNQTLGEINAKFGTAARTPVTLQQMPWNSSLIVSGSQIGSDKVLWRVTAPEGTTKIRVVETGEVFTLQGVGMWYESTPGKTITFVPA